ncbi:MAG: hypothetical protein M1819_002327 [Sarea resinae]|nr:MAG: hypothetical protein M1819_002327 [Sarea resinae]
MANFSSQAPGGFLPPTLPSPPASSVTSSTLTASLPVPRGAPLKPGSSKESNFINYVDRAILEITRRFAKKFSGGAEGQGGDGVKGYESFREVGRDIEKLVDVVWVSRTPSLQTPYLLSLALLVVTYLPSFPAAPRATFSLLHKLDLAFSSLIQGRDAETGEALPGVEGSRGALSTTEKVRIKSLVERTRIVVVETIRHQEYEEEDEEEDAEDSPTEAETADEDFDHPGAEGERWEMEVARVYDRTLVELGESLGSGGDGGLG